MDVDGENCDDDVNKYGGDSNDGSMLAVMMVIRIVVLVI